MRHCAAIVGSLVLVSGCGEKTVVAATPLPTPCIMVATAAIALAIRDSANGSAQENGTKVSAQFDSTGQYNVGTDSILGHDSLTVYVGWNPGIYDLRIQKTGYAQWDTSDVVVKPRPEAGESCQPVTKSITAYLRPAH